MRYQAVGELEEPARSELYRFAQQYLPMPVEEPARSELYEFAQQYLPMPVLVQVCVGL